MMDPSMGLAENFITSLTQNHFISANSLGSKRIKMKGKVKGEVEIHV